MNESDLLRTCKNYLDIKQIFYIRINSGGFKTEHGFYRMACPGVSDLIIIKDGRVMFVELKVGNNQLSGSQVIFKKRLEKNGGLYFVIRSLEELILLLE